MHDVIAQNILELKSKFQLILTIVLIGGHDGPERTALVVYQRDNVK
jgi:hypothetical protein